MKAYYSHRFVLPLPQGHRFPMDKYRRLHERIGGAGLGVELLEPPAASDDDLLRVHTPAYLRGVIDDKARKELVADLRLVPDLAGRVLDTDAEVEKVAHILKDIKGCLYLGRGINMPIAYEGALKLKEISYIHAEGYPAGEMKHGPIALIDEEMPVLCIAPKDPWHEKMISQIQQAKARGGMVIAVATEGDEIIKDMADHILWVPEAPWMLSPIVTVLPLQLLAYHIAAIRGLDVDQPRNLAKSVTVE